MVEDSSHLLDAAVLCLWHVDVDVDDEEDLDDEEDEEDKGSDEHLDGGEEETNGKVG